MEFMEFLNFNFSLVWTPACPLFFDTRPVALPLNIVSQNVSIEWFPKVNSPTKIINLLF